MKRNSTMNERLGTTVMFLGNNMQILVLHKNSITSGKVDSNLIKSVNTSFCKFKECIYES